MQRGPRPGQLILAGTTSATGNLNASAHGEVNNSGATYGGGAVSLSSDGTLTNSGAPGTNFNVGGQITILPTTAEGVYSGNMDVTVDY